MAFDRKTKARKENKYALIGLGAMVLGGFIGWYLGGNDAWAGLGALVALVALTLF